MTKNKTEKQEDWAEELDKKWYEGITSMGLTEKGYFDLKEFIHSLLIGIRQAGYEDGIKEAEKDNTLPEWIDMKIEQARKEERKRILNELPEEKIRWRKSDSENFEAGEENGYINGFNECLLEIEELLK